MIVISTLIVGCWCFVDTRGKVTGSAGPAKWD